MKKLFAALSISALLVVSLAQAGFSDLNSLHANYVAINSLVDQGILEGYEEDNSFRPEQAVTRSEAVKIIMLGMDREVDEDSIAAALFSDISEDDWSYATVGTAVTLGMINGYDDGTFRPNDTVKLAEAMKILLLASEASLLAHEGANPFPDVSGGDWFIDYAAYAKTWNIAPPQMDGLWHPEDAVSRADISEMVYRMQNVQLSGEAFDESSNWLHKDFPTVDVSMKVPFGWYIKQEGVGAAWLFDEENKQLSLLDPYANGGTLLMTRNGNGLARSSSEMFGIIEANTGASSTRGSINGYSSLTVYTEGPEIFREWYLVMDNGSLVHFQGLRGQGDYAPYLEDYMQAMVESVEFTPDGEVELSIEDILDSLYSVVQVDGSGQAAMDLLNDLRIIETDSIGVGTGPVDYFYSPSTNITIKYERSFDVILAIEGGETTAF